MPTLHPLNTQLKGREYRPGAPAKVEGMYRFEGQFFDPQLKGRNWRSKVLEMGTTVNRIPFRDKVVLVYTSRVWGFELWTALEQSSKGGTSWTLMRPEDVQAVNVYFKARQAFQAQWWAKHGKVSKEWRKRS